MAGTPAIPMTLVQSPNTTIHGNAGQLVPQSGGKMTFNRYGVAIMYQSYQIDKTLAVTQAPKNFAPHPFYPELLNSIGEMSITFGEVFADISCVYRGYFFSFGGTPDPVYEMNDALTSQPIDTHPQFVALIGGTYAAPLNNAVFDPVTKLFKGFPPDATNGLGGVKSWLAPSITWKMTVIYDTGQADQVGFIQTPQGPFPDISPRTWILYSVTQREQGNAFQASLEWRASDPGAQWNTLIYQSSP